MDQGMEQLPVTCSIQHPFQVGNGYVLVDIRDPGGKKVGIMRRGGGGRVIKGMSGDRLQWPAGYPERVFMKGRCVSMSLGALRSASSSSKPKSNPHMCVTPHFSRSQGSHIPTHQCPAAQIFCDPLSSLGPLA